MRGSSEGGPLRVLYVDNSSTFGGAIISLGHLVASLDRTRVKPLVVSTQPLERLRELFDEGEALHVPMWVPWDQEPAPAWARKLPGARSARGLWNLATRRVGTARALAEIGRDVRAELVHLNNVIEGQVDGALAARLLRVPCVAHARGFQKPTRAARLYARMPAAHVAISRSIADNLLELGVDESRVRVIHNGVDPDPFEGSFDRPRVRIGMGLPEHVPAFGFFGRIVPWKGVLELVEAAAVALRRVPEARAIVVGDESDGSRAYVRAVRDRVEALGIADRVVFTGYRPDIPALMSAVDVVVHTSVEPEPFGLVVAEAMAAGRPVVAANEGGPRDIVVDGETGRLMDPRDAEAFGHAVADLLEDRGLAERMGRAGRARVRDHFSRAAVARAVETLYGELA